MADKKLDLRVISPTTATDKSPYKYQKAVDMVILRCITGDLGILSGRVPCSMVLDTGVLRIFNDDTENHIAIMGGIAHVSDDIVTVLTDSAQTPEEIDIKKVTAEQKESRRLHDEATDLNQKQIFQKDLRRCQVLLDVARAD